MMKLFTLGIATFLASLSAFSNPSSLGTVLLQDAIRPDAAAGDLVQFVDRECRYLGTLVREAADPEDGLIGMAQQAARVDTGRWRVSIMKQVCRDVTADVHLRVDLPRPPSLVGGGGIPPAPMGYQAGTRFTLTAN